VSEYRIFFEYEKLLIKELEMRSLLKVKRIILNKVRLIRKDIHLR